MARGERPSSSAQSLIPPGASLPTLRQVADGCRACDLWEKATHTVFSEGSGKASLMLVGEMPSSAEDLAGRPFVGPAGKLLDRALGEAGIDRASTYVTNVVKHFRWEPQGKRRIHAKPSSRQIAACLPWLQAEIALVRPKVLVCLGATAAQALLGRDFRVSTQRARLIESSLAPHLLATVHPSSILRSPDEASRRSEFQRFVDDLRKVAPLLVPSPSG